MKPEAEFNEQSFVLARLLTGPIYREDGVLWDALRAERAAVERYFRMIGQEVIVDESEGYGFIRQLELEGVERVPRVGQRQPLSYHATLLLVCLREELARFDMTPDSSSRLVKTRQALRDLVAEFLRETNNEVRDARQIDTAIRRLEALGFLRSFGSAESESFEVMRIVKARMGVAELNDIKSRLSGGPETDGSDGQ